MTPADTPQAEAPPDAERTRLLRMIAGLLADRQQLRAELVELRIGAARGTGHVARVG